MRSLKIVMVRFCQPCTNLWTPRVRRCVRKTKTKPLPPPKLRGKRGILLGKEPKERRKQKKSPKTGEIPKETKSNPNRHSGAKKRAVGNKRKIETGQRRACGKRKQLPNRHSGAKKKENTNSTRTKSQIVKKKRRQETRKKDRQYNADCS